MNKTMLNLFRHLLLILLLLPVTVSAQSLYSVEGKILEISNRSINLSDAEYRVSPTVKVFLKKNKKGQVSDLKRGNLARISIIKIDKKRYVDTIQVIEKLTPNESNAINLRRE